MGAPVTAKPIEIVERMHNAMNQHDLESFLACFDPGYRSEQPAHPNRGFGGREQVEKNFRTAGLSPDGSTWRRLKRPAGTSTKPYAAWRKELAWKANSFAPPEYLRSGSTAALNG
jgi:hypothetical protein